MTISTSIGEALNTQIGREFAASLKYESIASYFASESLLRLAKFYSQQATEERAHAHRLMKYVLDTGGRVRIPAIEETPWDFSDAEAAAQVALDSELSITKAINALMDQAQALKDHATVNMLQWFVNEQVEEVTQAEHMLRIIQKAGEDGLLLVEDYIGELSEGKAA
jgi:ferritin